MATRSSILAWRIPQTEEPGGLQSVGVTESQTMTKQLNSTSPQHPTAGWAPPSYSTTSLRRVEPLSNQKSDLLGLPILLHEYFSSYAFQNVIKSQRSLISQPGDTVLMLSSASLAGSEALSLVSTQPSLRRIPQQSTTSQVRLPVPCCPTTVRGPDHWCQRKGPYCTITHM